MPSQPVERLHRAVIFLFVLATAVLIVMAMAARTNQLGPVWDTRYYLDMATNGILGNQHLVAPFAYRPAAPLIVYGLSHYFQLNPQATFRLCDAVMCVVFAISSFYFTRAVGASVQAAWLSSSFVSLYFFVIKWTIFSGMMVDIYAYPIILAAFLALFRGRFYLCLLLCSIGLFFKEFLLLPLLTQLILLFWTGRKELPLRVVVRTLFIVLAILICFLLPRLLIHVVATYQDIDPINNPSSLRLLIAYPLNIKRNFNILFYYLACWLPVLLLINVRRLRMLAFQLRDHYLLLSTYLALHFLLVMYGGTNLDVFVTYSLPVELLVLSILIGLGEIRRWEKALLFAVVIAFNRLWMYVPLPEHDINAYLNFYGGYHTSVSARSFMRMVELICYVAAFNLIRRLGQSRSLVFVKILGQLHSG